MKIKDMNENQLQKVKNFKCDAIASCDKCPLSALGLFGCVSSSPENFPNFDVPIAIVSEAKEIRYEISGINCFTPCPYNQAQGVGQYIIQVGSYACKNECAYIDGFCKSRQVVFCKYEGGEE